MIPPSGMVGRVGTLVQKCECAIDLSTPNRRERVKDFQPPWRTVFIYQCPKCGAEHRIRASSFMGSRSIPGVGAVVCGRALV